MTQLHDGLTDEIQNNCQKHKEYFLKGFALQVM